MPETGNNHIDFNKSEQYTLSIRLSADGFSFSIYNPIQDTFISFMEKESNPSLSLTANLKLVFSENETLTLNYKAIHIVVVNNRFTNIPQELFDVDQVNDVFYFNHTKQTNEVLLWNKAHESQNITIFGIDKSAYQLLKTYYPEASFYSNQYLLSEYFAAKSHFGNTRKVYLSLNDKRMDIYCYERGNLLMNNTFEAHHLEDRLYFIFAVWKQLNLDQQRDELFLTGTLVDKDAMMTQLKRYILQVSVYPKNNIEQQALLDYASN